jgi:hypothetical protein
MFRRIVLVAVFLGTIGIAESTLLGQYFGDPTLPRRGYDYAGAPYYPGYGPPYYPGYGPPYYPGYGPPYYPGYGPPYAAGISPHDPNPWYLYSRPPYRTAYPGYVVPFRNGYYYR